MLNLFSMLKTAVLLNSRLLKIFFFLYYKSFTAIFDQFNASLLNKVLIYF